MAQHHRLSRSAFDRLKAEHTDLTTRGRIEIARKIETARELGDLSENGDYHAAKEEQGKMEGRIRHLSRLLESATIVEDVDAESVQPGCVVSVRYEGDDDVERYLVGSIEERREGLDVVSPGSPLGAALIGSKIGDEQRRPERSEGPPPSDRGVEAPCRKGPGPIPTRFRPASETIGRCCDDSRRAKGPSLHGTAQVRTMTPCDSRCSGRFGSRRRWRRAGPRRSGAERPLGGPKQRLVIALLLARPNTTRVRRAPDRRSVGRVPPESARHTLQSYVSELRKTVGDVIERDGSGYSIRVDREGLDALELEDRVSAA